jgi:uncharacterized membrane protein
LKSGQQARFPRLWISSHRIWQSSGSALARLPRDRRGFVIVMVALLIPAFIGLTGLGAETGLWYAIKRQNQSAADEAAISGAMEVAANVADITAQATTTATRNGFNNNAPNTITVNNPPSSGPNSNNQDAVEVILSQQQGGLFASLYMPNVTIKTRAVALANSTGACVVALAPSGQDAVNVTGNATVDARMQLRGHFLGQLGKNT